MAIDIKKILLVGDTHGSFIAAKTAHKAAKKFGCDIKLQLGDHDLSVNLDFAKCWHSDEIPTYWLAGNHDHYDWLREFNYLDAPDFVEISKGYFFIPHGHWWTWCDKKFVSLGGAVSVDKDARVKYIDFFPEETATVAQVQRAMGAGKVDIMLCHDVPHGGTILESQLKLTEDLWPPRVLVESRQYREVLRDVATEVQPEWLFHGHYHYTYHDTISVPKGAKDIHNIEVFGLAQELKGGSMGILDLEAGTYQPISASKQPGTGVLLDLGVGEGDHVIG